MNIVKYSTPIGDYFIDENFKIFRGINQDFGFNDFNLPSAILYIENKIDNDIQDARNGLDSQIEMLELKKDQLGYNSKDYRIVL